MALSNTKETKQLIDNTFIDNWTLTPIHYAGAKFNSKNIDEWVNIVYEPRGGALTGLNGTSTSTRGVIYAVCWSETSLNTMELVDNVILFIDRYLDKNIIVRGNEIIDQGYDENNKSFMVVSFPINSYIGCTDR